MPPDEAETLLNELLAQAEAKMALEAESQRAEAASQERGDRKQEPEKEPEGDAKAPSS